jgi:pimeloyl-ACP methyl ester carboxylesterase
MTDTAHVREIAGTANMALPQLEGVEHHFVDLPGLRVHVAEAGQGEPVLLLHGFAQHWWEWRKVIPGLAGRYRVICPDLRGAGWTGAPPSGYTRDQMLADIVALLDALNVDRFHLICHDMGALPGFQLCLNHPGRVRAFLALSTPHIYVRFHPGFLKVMLRLWFQPLIGLRRLGPRLLSRGRQRLLRHLLLSYVHDTGTWTERDIELFLAPLREPARARAGSALYRELIMPESRRILRGAYRGTRLATPTRLLVGAKDPAFRPEFLGGHEDYCDDLTVESVDGAAHYLVDERPDVVVAGALAFFAGRE